MKAKSSRGAATRQRIIEAAAKLMQTNGVNGTSVDDVLSASATGKSQFYHYFVSKDALVRELVPHYLAALPAAREEALAGLGTLAGVEAWLDQILADLRGGIYEAGCPIGNLASELAAQNEDLRLCLQEIFAHWELRLGEGLAHIKSEGGLRSDVDPQATAVFVLAAIEGALLLCKTHKSERPLAAAVDQLKQHLRQAAALGQAHPAEASAATVAAKPAATSRAPSPPRRPRPPISFCP